MDKTEMKYSMEEKEEHESDMIIPVLQSCSEDLPQGFDAWQPGSERKIELTSDALTLRAPVHNFR